MKAAQILLPVKNLLVKYKSSFCQIILKEDSREAVPMVPLIGVEPIDWAYSKVGE